MTQDSSLDRFYRIPANAKAKCYDCGNQHQHGTSAYFDRNRHIISKTGNQCNPVICCNCHNEITGNGLVSPAISASNSISPLPSHPPDHFIALQDRVAALETIINAWEPKIKKVIDRNNEFKKQIDSLINPNEPFGGDNE